MQLFTDEGIYRREHFRVDKVHAEPHDRPGVCYYNIYSETVPGCCLHHERTESEARRWVDRKAEAWLRKAMPPLPPLQTTIVQTITVTKRSHDWRACLKDVEGEKLVDGALDAESAVGYLIMSWPECFGLKVTVIE